jgi:acetyl esterase/lipase
MEVVTIIQIHSIASNKKKGYLYFSLILAMFVAMKNQQSTFLTLKHYRWLLLLLATLITAGGCTQTMKATDALNAVISQNHYTVKTTQYGNRARQGMDIYLPNAEKQQKTNKPVIVFVYGGAWRDGNKEDYKFVGHALTELGHPVIIPDYQLFPQVKFPVFIEDIAQAISYTEKNAQRLLSQPMDNYILMGHSAGAHTAALLTVDANWTKNAGVTANLKGLIALSGPYDLPLDDPEVSPVFPSNPTQVNPILNITAPLPPVLLLHGKKDDRVFPFHTERFAEAIKRSGNTVNIKIYPRTNHAMVLGNLAAPLRLFGSSYTDIKAFLGQD